MKNGVIKALVFDFDGVIIVDSEFIKEDTWKVIASELGDNSSAAIEQARIKYSESNGSRYDIIREALKILKYPSKKINKLVNIYASRYNEVVQGELLKKGIAEDDKKVLKRLAKYYSLYINSATPEEAVQESIINFKIGRIFKGVYGQPKKNQKI